MLSSRQVIGISGFGFRVRLVELILAGAVSEGFCMEQ